MESLLIDGAPKSHDMAIIEFWSYDLGVVTMPHNNALVIGATRRQLRHCLSSHWLMKFHKYSIQADFWSNVSKGSRVVLDSCDFV